jgi:universal stress protein E
MSEQQKIFVVIDPNDSHHAALERVVITATLRDVKPIVHVFVATDPEAVDTRSINGNLFRDLDWFEQAIKKPLSSAGVNYNIEVSWSKEWQKSILESAKRFGSDLIYLPIHAATPASRLLFTESKWELLKSSTCPVVLIRPGAKAERKVVLAAINVQGDREVQKELNRKIVSEAKHYAEIYDADFHVVNGYMDSLNYPDRAKILAATGLPNDRVHVENGYTSEVVANVADKISADLIVMGTLGQTGMSKTRRGNTAERLIMAVDTDVMVISHE